MILTNNTEKDIYQYIDTAIHLDIHTIKVNNNKTIGLLKNKPIVIKHFSLSGLKRVVHKKYALSEFKNLKKAQALGILTPNAIFFYSDKKFFPKTVIIGMSQVLNATLLNDIINIKKPQDSIIQSLAVMLITLYKTGANHIDLSPDNIFINNNNSATIIDWQYANFVKPYSRQQFVMQTAQLLKYLNKDGNLNIESFLLKLFHYLPKELQGKSTYDDIQNTEKFHITKKQRFNV
jgi:tRNA A-37 threonylcarbamoyl transferase component Bud32